MTFLVLKLVDFAVNDHTTLYMCIVCVHLSFLPFFIDVLLDKISQKCMYVVHCSIPFFFIQMVLK